MDNVRDLLHSTIETLSDEEAEEALRFLQKLHDQAATERIIRDLAQDPAIRVPEPGKRKFRHFEPVEMGGRPASEMLIEDRR
jgi:hypothetical protein